VLLHPDTGWVNGMRADDPETRAWIRFSDQRPVDASALLFFSDALPPSVFEVLPDRSWVPTIELTVQVRALPAPGWLRAVTRTRHLIDGRFEEDGELWDATGRLVALSRQLGMVLSA
jgi:acyl-CoA thioesterase